MKFNNYAFIYLCPGFSPENNTSVSKNDQATFTAVGLDFADKAKVIDVAKQLIADGVQMIELCGGFGPTWIVKIQEAIDYTIPIGGAFYGPEARQPILDLIK